MSAGLDIERLSPALGARIPGVDLAADLDDGTVAAIRAAFNEHQILVFPDQDLTPERQVAFSARFGEPMRLPYVEPMADHPEVIAVLKEADEVRVSTFGSWWHADFSYLERPPMASILHARELPPNGGDTLFASMTAAWEALSDGMKALIGPLNAMQSGHIYARPAVEDERRATGVRWSLGNEDASAERLHPVVRVHPETGRKALNVNPTYTVRFEDMTEAESRPLLDWLYAHTGLPQFTYRHRWREGEVVMWDNRATLHLAVNDYDGHRRLLHRTAVAGDVPAGPRS